MPKPISIQGPRQSSQSQPNQRKAPRRAPRPKASQKATMSKNASAVSPVSPEERRRMIEQAAYYLAEQRGFPSGQDTDIWLEAEAQVDQMLGGREGGTS